MKIAYNPLSSLALTAAPAGNDITFDLPGINIYVRGVRFKGTDTTYNVFKKHTSSGSGGYNGLVPVPSHTTTSVRYLREDGTWQVPTPQVISSTYTQLSNEDFNSLREEGRWYFIPGSSTTTNGPTGVNNGAELYIGRNASGYRYLKVITAPGIVWFRYWNSTAWTSWTRWYTDANTDKSVLQSESTTANFRPLLSGYTNNSNPTLLFGATTNQVYASKGLYVLPSTATIFANKFNGDLIGNADTSTSLGNTNVGNAALPVYFASGKPIACTASSLFSGLTNDASQISITIAGLNRKLTVDYASNAGTLGGLAETSFFRTRGYYGSIASNIPTTAELSTSNGLNGSWTVGFPGAGGHLMQFNAGGGSTRYVLLYSHYSSSLYWRNSTDSTFSSKPWRTIVDSANYTDIVLKIGTATKGSATLPIYLNAGTPTACSTTLGVSITGNAATATKLLTARTINGTSFDGTTNITTAYWGATRTITLSGAVTGSASVNGSLNVTITTTYQTGSIDGRYVGGNKTANHGSSGTAYTADTYSSNFVNKAFVAYAERGSWDYANNGYITTDTGVNIPLAGTAIFQWGASDTNKTLLFITPYNNSGVSNPAANEMLFYTSNGSGYTSAWTRVLTHRNYTAYTVTKTGGGASGTWGISITGSAPWANITGKPTTLSGYGITDAYSKTQTDAKYLPLTGGTLTGALNMNGRIIINPSGYIYPASTNTRSSGVYGVYDSTRIGHIWSIGTAFTIPNDGATFGNLYGLAYKHTNNTTGGTMAGGHQAVWCTDGLPKAALGDSGVWTSGGFYKAGHNSNHLLRADGGAATFNWSGQDGLPTWLWGGNTQHTYLLYNPLNFNVAKANKADLLEAYTASNFTGGDHYLRAIRYDSWHTRLYMGYYRDTTLQNTVHVGYADNATTSSYLTLGFSATHTNNWNCNAPDRVVYSDYGSANRSISNAPAGWQYGTLLSLGHANLLGLNGSLSILLMWDVAHDTANGGTLWFRGRDSVKGWAKNWCKVVTDLNYTSVLDNRYVTSLGTSGNSLTWVKNGTTNNLTVPYATHSAHSVYLYTNYIGGVQHNPQTYFSSGTGLKVAMTANWSTWSDTLWINGYSGGDVLQCVAIHTLRNGLPRMALSALASNATSYGAKYEVWTSYNLTPGNYVTALDTSGDYLTWTRNGTTNNLTVPYSTRSGYLYPIASNPDNSRGTGYGARVFYSWNTGQANNSTAGWSNGITIGSHPSDAAYGFLIVQNMWDDRTYTRRYNSGWQAWKTLAWTTDILDPANYYWANIKVSTSSSTATLPTFNTCYTSNWFRSTGSTGWYSETHGGGIYMIDTTYVRVYNNKRFYAGAGYLAPYSGGSWISMATRTNCIVTDNNNSASSAHALFRAKDSSGNAIAFGGLGGNIGFYGFTATRITNGTNGTDWDTVWDVSTGNITHNKALYTAGYYHSAVNSNNYVILAGGSYKALGDFAKGNAGSATKGVYVTGGTVTAMTYSLSANLNSGTAGKLATYSSRTTVAAYNSTVGASNRGIYMSAGVPTVMTYYLNSTVNSGTSGKLAYYSSATVVAADTSTVGSVHSPVYINAGVPTICSYYSFLGAPLLPVVLVSGFFYRSATTSGTWLYTGYKHSLIGSPTFYINGGVMRLAFSNSKECSFISAAAQGRLNFSGANTYSLVAYDGSDGNLGGRSTGSYWFNSVVTNSGNTSYLYIKAYRLADSDKDAWYTGNACWGADKKAIHSVSFTIFGFIYP